MALSPRPPHRWARASLWKRRIPIELVPPLLVAILLAMIELVSVLRR